MVSMWVWASLAWGTPDLEVERGWVQMSLEHYRAARDHARAALGDDHDHAGARALYRASSAATGLGHRVPVELGTSAAAPWADAEHALRAAVASRDLRSSRNAARTLRASHPDHPELLAPLWNGDPSFVGLGARHVRDAARRLEAHDTVVLHRLLRLVQSHPVEPGFIDQFLARPAPRARIEQALRARGEVIFPPASPLSAVERGQAALTLLDAASPAPPPGPTSERLDVAARLAALYEQTERMQDATALYDRLAEDLPLPAVHLGLSRAWLALDRPREARSAADDALFAATGPLDRDTATLDAELRAADVAEALALRAEALEMLGERTEATVDLALSILVADRILNGALAERLAESARSTRGPVEMRYSPNGVAWRHAQGAAERAEDPATQRLLLADARYLAVAYTRGGMLVRAQPHLYRDVLATLLLAEPDDPEALLERRARLVLATEWLGAIDRGDAWVRRGAAHEALGEVDAAFEAYLRAHDLGVPDLEERLASTYVGPAEWTQLAGVREVAGGSYPSSDDWGLPEVGARFPNLRFDTAEGARHLGRITGRMLFVTLYSGDCTTCVSRLPMLGALAQEWREAGLETLSIGINLDDDPTHLERVVAVGAPWGALVHGPEIAAQLGVSKTPVTFLVDASGITRVVAMPEVPANTLFDEIRDLSWDKPAPE